MNYRIPGLGVIAASAAFVRDQQVETINADTGEITIETIIVTYPAGWLATASADELAALGAVAEPPTADELAAQAEADRADRISRAWSAADTHALAGADHNSRAQYLAWLIDPASSALRRERIAAVQAWLGAVWAHYAQVKAAILVGQAAAFDPAVPGPCPHDFWAVASA